MHQSFVTTASLQPLSRTGYQWPGKCVVFLLLHCLHNAEGMKGFDRPRQTRQCRIITDCGGELSWFCQLAVPTVWWLLLGTAVTKSLSSTFLWDGAWSQMTSALRRKKNAHQSFVTTPQPGKCAVSTGPYQRTTARKSKSPPFPGSVGRSYELLVY